MKLIIRIVIGVVVLLVVGVIAFFFYVDSVTKTAVERGGTYALGVPTSLNSADVGIFSGEFDMSGLTVANPEGYQATHFLQMDTGGVQVSLGSLMKDTVELPRLTISGVDMHLERQAGKANYQAIIDNLKRFESGNKDEAPPSDKKFIIREVLIQNVMVHVNMLGGGDISKVDVPIEEIRLTDVGTDSNKALLLSDLFDVVIKAILQAAVNKGGSLIPDDITGELSGALASLQDLDALGIDLSSTLGDVTGELEGIGGDLEKAAGDITREVGNLLGGGDEDDQ